MSFLESFFMGALGVLGSLVAFIYMKLDGRVNKIEIREEETLKTKAEQGKILTYPEHAEFCKYVCQAMTESFCKELKGLETRLGEKISGVEEKFDLKLDNVVLLLKGRSKVTRKK